MEGYTVKKELSYIQSYSYSLKGGYQFVWTNDAAKAEVFTTHLHATMLAEISGGQVEEAP